MRIIRVHMHKYLDLELNMENIVHYVPVHVIVIAQLTGIYGSKPTESEGVARGQGWFTSP